MLEVGAADGVMRRHVKMASGTSITTTDDRVGHRQTRNLRMFQTKTKQISLVPWRPRDAACIRLLAAGQAMVWLAVATETCSRVFPEVHFLWYLDLLYRVHHFFVQLTENT